MPDAMPNNLIHIEDEDLKVWRPKEWQKYIHAMYFGRIYFWQNDAIVKPIHLNKYQYYKEAGNWVEDFYEAEGVDLEGTYWHDENHPEAEYGGYWKTSKSKKEILLGKSVHIAESFKGTLRPPFKTKNWSLPRAKVWIDNQENWW
jgi:competence protein CoiA